jgi:hypothetical protein
MGLKVISAKDVISANRTVEILVGDKTRIQF